MAFPLAPAELAHAGLHAHGFVCVDLAHDGLAPAELASDLLAPDELAPHDLAGPCWLGPCWTMACCRGLFTILSISLSVDSTYVMSLSFSSSSEP